MGKSDQAESGRPELLETKVADLCGVSFIKLTGAAATAERDAREQRDGDDGRVQVAAFNASL